MCGIAGIINFEGEPVEEPVLVRMTDLLLHRGPDSGGTWSDGPVGLGHRRLSIIDLSDAGHQPMCNEDGSLWLVFNGEIYNYRELMPELAARGHTFRSRTDTEVILHAYEEWGVDCLRRFNGMWAFALWDTRRQLLFCARDRCGVKPFYYFQDRRRFVFGSEIKAVVSHPDVPREPDRETLYRFLRYHVKDMDESTCFAKVRQLLPAHYMVVAADGSTRTARYWTPGAEAEPLREAGDGEYAARLFELFEDSVRLRLRSDVPVGACLSGGLDSSAIVAAACGQLPHSLKTFSITYPGTAHDEDRFVRDMLADRANIDHRVETPDGSDAFDVLGRSVWHYDEPTWGPYVYSWWHVMRLVHSSDVTVILNGQGSDEEFAGYPAYYPTYLRQLLLEGRLGTFMDEARVQAQKSGGSLGSVLRLMALPLWPDSLRRSARQLGGGRTFDDSFLAAEFRHAAGARDLGSDRKAFLRLRDHLGSDLQRSRLPELLHAEDRFSMAFSLESRVPFLDYRLVDFAATLPDEQKLRRGVTKVVLRNAMRGRLPATIVDRADKMGYPTPGEAWFRTTARDQAGDLIHSRSFAEHGIFQSEVVRSTFERYCRGEASMRQLWRWLSVEVWMRQFFDQPLPRQSTPLLRTRMPRPTAPVVTDTGRRFQPVGVGS